VFFALFVVKSQIPKFFGCGSAALRYAMWIPSHHESGNPSHVRSVLDCLRSRQEEFSIVSQESSQHSGAEWSAVLAIERGVGEG